MAQELNVGFDFLKAAAGKPEQAAVIGEDVTVTYGQLAGLSVAMALHLARHGAGPGRLVAFRSDDVVAVLASVYATALLGCRWVYARAETLTQGRIRPDLVLETAPERGPGLPGAIRIDDSWADPPEGHDLSRPPQFTGYRDPADIWILSQTSGTTGTPKHVCLSFATVHARTNAHRALFPGDARGFVCLFPHSAPAFLSRTLAVLAKTGTLVMSLDPDFWMGADVGLVVGSVNQVRQFLGERVLPRKLGAVHLSGGQLPETLARHLLESFERVQNGYGSTETNNLLANIKTIDAKDRIATRTELRPGVAIEVVNEAGLPQPPGTEGIVRIHCPYLASGYLDAPETEAVAFRDGWFYPGDTGLWTTDGEFVVTGRLNDQFNLGGVKLNAALIDYTLQNIPGVRDAMAFMVPREGREERLTAFLSLEPAADAVEILGTARLELMRLGGTVAVPERLLFADKLPRNAHGKPDRRGCLALLEAGKAERTAKRT